MSSNPFVTTEWLQSRLDDPDLVVVDGSWFLPAANRDPRAEYMAGHIPGAVFFDLDALTDKDTGLPHMLMKPEDFGHTVGELGIGDGRRIVVYDEAGLYSAPRVRWNFLVMGAPDVVLLEGGGPKWRAEGRPLEAGLSRHRPVTFTPAFDAAAVADIGQMREFIDHGGRQVADARPAGRFRGETPEPRAGVKGGHMPGALSAPVDTLSEGGRLKSPEVLRAQFAAAGIDLERPIVTSCGSGVTAAALKLALEQAGAKDVILYDGSWSEWGGRDDTDVVKG